MGADTNADVWDKAYGVLGEIIREGRSQNSSYVPELYLLDEETDYEYDVCGWLEDYLDYLDEGEQYEKLRKICTELIRLFRWEEESSSDLRFYIASSLGAEGKKEEVLYKVSGNKKAEKSVSQAIKKYEEEIEAYFSDVDENGLDFSLDDIDDEDLPFN